MTLTPYPDRVYRWEKVIRHWFNLRERWWDLDDGGLQVWQAGWTTLRVAGVLATEGWLAIREGAASVVADDAHVRWLSAAERGVDGARERGTVFPGDTRDRVVYVGTGGVVVVVAGGARLVTCFRPEFRGTDPDVPDRMAVERFAVRSGVIDRAAIRRQSRRGALTRGKES